jgi:hypothetical protein
VLFELNGDDLRRDPLAVRKATLADVLVRAASGLRFNERLDEDDGPLVFHHACKNPNAPAVRLAHARRNAPRQLSRKYTRNRCVQKVSGCINIFATRVQQR